MGEASTEGQAKKLYIVDGSSYMYRAFYASPPLTNSKGMPTNGLFVFTNMITSLIRDKEPDLLAVAFDPPGPTFRHEEYEDYKANRQAPPDDLRVQMPYFRDIIKGMGIAVVEIPGYEADDVLGTMALQAAAAGLEVILVSADKDLLQLIVPEQVSMLDTMSRGKSKERLYTLKEVEDRFGVKPSQVADVLALMGDTSDNIPGVPGIGPKTAGKLIAEFGTVENLLENIDKVSGKKRRENLTANVDVVKLSKMLATIKTDLPIDLDLKGLELSGPQVDTLLPLFEELEFHRHIEDMNLRSDSGGEAALVQEQVERTYRLINTMPELDALLETLRGVERFAFDLAVSSTQPIDAQIIGLSLAWEPFSAVYIPFKHRLLTAPPQLHRGVVLGALMPLFKAEKPRKLCQKVKFQAQVLAHYDIDLQGVEIDTMIGSYLLDPGRRSHAVDNTAAAFLNESMRSYEDVLGKGKKAIPVDQLDVERATEYIASRADVILRLSQVMEGQLAERDLRALHDDIELPLAFVLGDTERKGIRVDSDLLHALSDELLGRMKKLEARATELIGRVINLNSPKQLSEVLFKELKLEPKIQRQTTHGYSTDQAHLELLADQHELPGIVIEYRTVSKLRSTYTETLPGLVHPKTQRIHTSFNQAVAATGRLSSSDPNLQNIPVRTEEGRRIRRAFLPATGWKLLSADYSQIELRLMAHFSKDPTLLEAFTKGQDIHARTAAEIFDLPIEKVTKDQRRTGKTVNFGVLYGMGSWRLARDLELTREEAETIIRGFFDRFSAVAEYFDSLVQKGLDQGYVTTLMGRRRFLPELRSSRRNLAELGRRLAINTPIQGTAADLIKLAMIRVAEALAAGNYRTRMLLQVHDELVFEAPPEELEPVARMVREVMEAVWSLDVALRVDLAAGDNWADLEPLEV